MRDACLGKCPVALAILWTASAAGTASVTSTGCGEAEAQDPVVVESPCAQGVPMEYWESSSWPPDEACPWLVFEGRTSVRVPHTLGRRPREVSIYLSFEPNGRSGALAAGDLSRILEVTETQVTLRNDTNEDFFVKVVLH